MTMSTTQDPSLDYKVSKRGLKRGPNNEMFVFFRIKPGHEEQAARDLAAFQELLDKHGEPAKLGLHEAKLGMLENNTRLFFTTTFDPEVDPYLDDAIFRLWGAIHAWARHCEGYPGTMDTHPDPNKTKEWWMTNWNTCTVYFRPYARTFHEIVKALSVYDAFQKVLDDPASHRALQDPALQPLLALAAD
jgi:hypothetical protein